MSLQHVDDPELWADLDLMELDPPARVLIWALRALAIGRGDCPLLLRQLEACCGPRTGEAFAAMFVLVKQLAWRSPRPLKLHLPGCRALSQDELDLLAAVAAAQAPSNSGEKVASRLRGLIGATANPLLTEAVMLISDAIGINGRTARQAGPHRLH